MQTQVSSFITVRRNDRKLTLSLPSIQPGKEKKQEKKRQTEKERDIPLISPHLPPVLFHQIGLSFSSFERYIKPFSLFSLPNGEPLPL